MARDKSRIGQRRCSTRPRTISAWSRQALRLNINSTSKTNGWKTPHITSVRSSCGCTTPKIDKQLLKTWEKAELTAIINTDTRQYYGRKDATITVKFDLPFPAEVQVHITRIYSQRRGCAAGRSAIRIGQPRHGNEAKEYRSVTPDATTGGSIGLNVPIHYVEGQVTEVSRAGGLVKYNLSVKLKANAPAGYIQDQLFLVTNDKDQRSARVPVAVEGVISQALSVRPSPLLLGVVEAGQPVTRPLVIQGKTPFRITSVRSSDPRFQCKLPEGAKSGASTASYFRCQKCLGQNFRQDSHRNRLSQCKTAGCGCKCAGDAAGRR